MGEFDPVQYGPVFAELLSTDRCRPLDEGEPNREHFEDLQALSVSNAFAHAQVSDGDMARCCLAGIWLLYDFLDESHTVSQGISSPSGSFWHGIMHRREGDFSNAKYWFRRVGEHPVYERLADELTKIGSQHLQPDNRWDPFEFVDACESAVSSRGPAAESCQRVQQLEWELLFDHCYSAATT